MNHTPHDLPAETSDRWVTSWPTGWRCREHLRPVSWRGTGCPDCVGEMLDRQERRVARKAERAARRRQDATAAVRWTQ